MWRDLGMVAGVDHGLWHTKSLHAPLLISFLGIIQLIVLSPDA